MELIAGKIWDSCDNNDNSKPIYAALLILLKLLKWPIGIDNIHIIVRAYIEDNFL